MENSNKALKIIAIGGGKGGVGKSVLTANIGYCLTQLGHRVVCLDTDLGGANLHTILGVKYPEVTLNDFFQKKVPFLSNTLIQTQYNNLYLISGANGILDLANPKFAQKTKLINSLSELEADYLLLDLGAGSDYNVLDFFSVATGKVVVATPEPTSIQNVYGFLKNALYRRLLRNFTHNSHITNLIKESMNTTTDGSSRTIERLIERVSMIEGDAEQVFRASINEFNVQLILNNIASDKQVKAANILETVAEKFLGMKLFYAGAVHNDPHVSKSVIQMEPFMHLFPSCQAAADIRGIEEKMRMEMNGFQLKRPIPSSADTERVVATHH